MIETKDQDDMEHLIIFLIFFRDFVYKISHRHDPLDQMVRLVVRLAMAMNAHIYIYVCVCVN